MGDAVSATAGNGGWRIANAETNYCKYVFYISRIFNKFMKYYLLRVNVIFMSKLLNISDLDFGRDDANMEGGFLGKVFLKTSFYNRVKKGNKFLVTGRIGSGKTAICISLKNALEQEKEDVIYITPNTLSVSKINEIADYAINEEEKYQYIWKYIFLVKIAKNILAYKHKHKYKIYSVHEIEKFLYQNNEVNNLFLTIKYFRINFFRAINLIKKITLKFATIEAEINQNKQHKDFNDLIDNLENNIITVLNQIKNLKITILVDEIDNIWNNSSQSKQEVIGLLNTIRKINSITNIIIITFIRSDIWDSLSFTDKNKFRSDEERIFWHDQDLKNLITIRGKISANIDDLDSTEVDKIWELLFDKKVSNKDSFEYILERTLKRPREIIQYCNEALSLAQNDNASKIKSKYILDAELRYSVWKLDDLINEFKVQYPYLRDLLGIFQGYYPLFYKNEIDIRFNKGKKSFINKFPILNNLNIEAFLQLLFGIGFIGIRVNHKTVFYYNDPTYPRIIINNISNLNYFVIHPAFLPALGFKHFKGIRQGKNSDYFEQVQIGGDFIGNININNDINFTKEEEELAEKIRLVLVSLCDENFVGEPTQNAIVASKAVTKIETDFELKQNILILLKKGRLEKIINIINHPAASIFIEVIKELNN